MNVFEGVQKLQTSGRSPEGLDGDEALILGVLNAIGTDSKASQRELARQLGIALGLANACLKRCIKKGYVKMTQAPANRYMYYLTPTGFAEKARLTADYLSQSFGFFREARAQCVDVIHQCERAGLRSVAMVGASDLCEILLLCTSSSEVRLVGLVAEPEGVSLSGPLPVARSRQDLPPHDGVVITALTGAQDHFDRLVSELGGERVFAPAMLCIDRSPPVLME